MNELLFGIFIKGFRWGFDHYHLTFLIVFIFFVLVSSVYSATAMFWGKEIDFEIIGALIGLGFMLGIGWPITYMFAGLGLYLLFLAVLCLIFIAPPLLFSVFFLKSKKRDNRKKILAEKICSNQYSDDEVDEFLTLKAMEHGN